jgi:hypothetical protein
MINAFHFFRVVCVVDRFSLVDSDSSRRSRGLASRSSKISIFSKNKSTQKNLLEWSVQPPVGDFLPSVICKVCIVSPLFDYSTRVIPRLESDRSWDLHWHLAKGFTANGIDVMGGAIVTQFFDLQIHNSLPIFRGAW